MAQRHGRTLLTLSLSMIAALAATPARADATREYQLKAAFLHHFAQFVEWPPGTFSDEKAPIILATLGADPFEGELDRVVAGKTVGGRRVVVKHFPRPTEVQQCQLLFVGSESDELLPAALQKLGRAGVLTVGETDKFMEYGGIIRFYSEDNRVRFDISQEATARARLRISAKLLRLAKPRG